MIGEKADSYVREISKILLLRGDVVIAGGCGTVRRTAWRVRGHRLRHVPFGEPEVAVGADAVLRPEGTLFRDLHFKARIGGSAGRSFLVAETQRGGRGAIVPRDGDQCARAIAECAWTSCPHEPA